MKAIDLNVDMGEGFGNDIALLEFATSVNIACGWHAGDAATMRRTAAAALKRGVAIGAHPSYSDRENFGRVVLNVTTDEIYTGVLYQIGALAAIVKGLGGHVSHVKPHGALYNEAERDENVADAIVRAVRDHDSSMAVFGLAEGQLVDAARRAGLTAFDEVFADRGYTAEGKLVPRNEPGALIEADADALQQVLEMVRHQHVKSVSGGYVSVRPDTVCLHGDGEHALTFAQEIRAALRSEGVTVTSPTLLQHASRPETGSRYIDRGVLESRLGCDE
ncbi:hypothetical protein BWP39_15730 [Paraburkholderia acidicola]|uniref:5-oxoprolinase subunit A n=1 Tax=Paraburkholderia acidicola TaxID=1912599 RepID=A0A2A4F013_9BURK|nr:5-oxoprolinase subunit PxpA [Paraburkholderia acidicola]PCE25978.1 hypothetical protein BWP39_15730 [Paraburkholderia acidicola]